MITLDRILIDVDKILRKNLLYNYFIDLKVFCPLRGSKQLRLLSLLQFPLVTFYYVVPPTVHFFYIKKVFVNPSFAVYRFLKIS